MAYTYIYWAYALAYADAVYCIIPSAMEAEEMSVMMMRSVWAQ